MTSNPELYEINVRCSNCDYEGTKKIKKGVMVSPRLVCPNCDNLSAVKAPRQKLVDAISGPKYSRDIPYYFKDQPKPFPPPDGTIWC